MSEFKGGIEVARACLKPLAGFLLVCVNSFAGAQDDGRDILQSEVSHTSARTNEKTENGVEQVSVPAASNSQTLHVGKDDVSVRAALQRWCLNNGWQLVWQADVDFLVETEMRYGSDIKEALPVLFEHLSTIGPRLHAVMFMQNKVLLVRRLR